MRDGRGSHCPSRLSPGPDWLSPRYKGSRSEANLYSHLDQCDAHHYPSPPMSSPPSPPSVPREQTTSPSHVLRIVDSDATSRATPSSMPTATAIGSSYGPTIYGARDSAHFRHASSVTTSSQSSQAPSAYSPVQTKHSFGSRATYLPPTDALPTEPSLGQRTGRKSKAHVASACINCKRAHLSCDVSRPCTRCVSSGKQDSCYDVQHKKRGRPRLREEGSSTLDHAASYHAHSAAAPISESAFPRPIAAPRPRRAESFRSLQSQDSEAAPSSPLYPQVPPPTATAASFEHQSFAHTADYEVPAAYLDMDLIILKANQSFCQIMSIDPGGAAGTELNKLAIAVDGQSFQSIRADLSIERERRDPAYMPPIVQTGQDILGGALLEDIDHYAQGSDDRNYTWTQNRPNLSNDRFPARVRLAKAQAWFVALTLPSFRPGPPPIYSPPRAPSFAPHSYLNRSEQSASSQHFASYSAPATIQAPFTYEAPLSAPHRTPGHQPTRSYPPPQPPLPYQQQAQRPTTAQRYPQNVATLIPPPSATTPRLSTARPGAFTPRSAPRELPPSHDSIPPTGIQLPPILGHTTTLVANTSGRLLQAGATPTTHAGFATGSSNIPGEDVGDTSRSPRKRRKLDLHDVLHKY